MPTLYNYEIEQKVTAQLAKKTTWIVEMRKEGGREDAFGPFYTLTDALDYGDKHVASGEYVEYNSLQVFSPMPVGQSYLATDNPS